MTRELPIVPVGKIRDERRAIQVWNAANQTINGGFDLSDLNEISVGEATVLEANGAALTWAGAAAQYVTVTDALVGPESFVSLMVLNAATSFFVWNPQAGSFDIAWLDADPAVPWTTADVRYLIAG